MAKKDYTPLEKLTSELNSKVKQLKSGELTPNEVSGLVKSSLEVYNRLIVLEFQMHESSSSTAAENEVIEEEPALESQEKEEENMPEFDFNMSKEQPKEEAKKEIVKEESASVDALKPVKNTVQEPKTEKAPESPEDTIKEDLQGGSLAEKFENAPIKDISKAFSLNEKFQFMRVFFNQNVNAPDGEEDKEVYESFKELILRRFN